MQEMVYYDPDNTQLPTDPDEVQCTQAMWRKFVWSAPSSYVNSLAVMDWKGKEAPTVDEVADQLWQYKESLSSFLILAVEKLFRKVQQSKEDMSYSPPVTQKKNDFKWVPVQHQAFEQIEEKIVHAVALGPVWAEPDVKNVLYTAASENGPTWSLWQKASGETQGQPMGFGSWGYRGSKTYYITTEKEILQHMKGNFMRIDIFNPQTMGTGCARYTSHELWMQHATIQQHSLFHALKDYYDRWSPKSWIKLTQWTFQWAGP
nr:PREDICTED: uncharacterized protein LOC104635577 [Balearica regulorum gibbericeps]